MTDKGIRQRLPLVALVAVCVTAVTVAVSGAADPTGGLRFAHTGHWISNALTGLVFHIDGSSKTVDAKVPIAGLEAGSQVVQGDTSAYVVGGSRVDQFGKSNLSVDGSYTPPVTGEQPTLVETDGGPYLVYKEAGQVVRSGSDFQAISAGGALAEPVATPDGTLWLQQRGSGRLCELPKSANEVACPITLPDRHFGALTVVGKRAVFVDTTSDDLRPIDGDALGEPVKINADVSDSAKIAPTSAGGRIPILEQATHRLLFVDAGGIDGRKAAPPVPVSLPDGQYSGPSASDSAVVVLNLTDGTVHTYGSDGAKKQTVKIPAEAGEPRLVRGDDDRVYVDGGEAKHVMVVDPGGAVTPVALPVAGPDKPAPPSNPVNPPPVSPPVSSDVPNPPAKSQPPVKHDPVPDVKPQNTPKSTPQKPPDPPAPPAQTPTPPSPPGAAGNLKAKLNGANATVTWGAAAANGGPITAYHVSWEPSSGSGAGSATTAPGTRTRTISGIGEGITYTITVVAENSAGTGTAATTTVTRPKPTRLITLTRGPAYSGDPAQCDPANCAWMHVVLKGFTPGTTVELKPHSTAPGYSNPGHGQLIEADGTGSANVFYYAGVGETVYVSTEDGSVRSANLVWSAG